MCELGTFDEGEDDGILQARKNASDLVQIQRVASKSEVEQRLRHVEFAGR